MITGFPTSLWTIPSNCCVLKCIVVIVMDRSKLPQHRSLPRRRLPRRAAILPTWKRSDSSRANQQRYCFHTDGSLMVCWWRTIFKVCQDLMRSCARAQSTSPPVENMRFFSDASSRAFQLHWDFSTFLSFWIGSTASRLFTSYRTECAIRMPCFAYSLNRSLWL